MNIFYLSFRQIINKPLATFLCILILSLGVCLMSILLIFKQELEKKFDSNLQNIDLVIGAKGSPLQLILSAVYHLDNPTGNIPLEDAQKIEKSPFLKNVIFLAYGDTYQSFRIVGTNTNYPKIYNAKIQQGVFWKKDFEVNLGYTVAKKIGLKVGDKFHGSHGNEGEEHHHDYKVVGILDKTNTVIDQLILTNVGSLWESHEQGEEEREITAILASFANPMARVMLPAQINSIGHLQVALPALEINRLYDMLGIGVEAIQVFAYLIVSIAALTIFITLYNALKERRFEVALMRSMGASRLKMYFFVIFEGFWLSILGLMMGFLWSRLGLFGLNFLLADYHYDWSYMIWVEEEIFIVLFCVLVGVISAFLPAWQAAKTDIAKTLS